MSLRTRLILAFLILSVLPLTVIVLYSYFTSLETLRWVALNEVADLTNEIGERIETIRSEVDQGVERLSSSGFSYQITTRTEPETGQDILGDIDLALGAAAPFVESLEFVPAAPAPPVPTEGPEVTLDEVPEVAPAQPVTLQSVIISLRDLAQQVPATADEQGEMEEEGETDIISQVELEAEIAGHEVAEALAGMDLERLAQRARSIAEERSRLAADSRRQAIEHSETRAEHQRRVVLMQPQKIGESEMVWKPDLLEQDEVEQLEQMEQESRLLLGREFDRSVELDGRTIGRLRAQVSARKLLEQVLHQAEREQGEIPFAIDGEGNLFVARNEDRALLAGLPLSGEGGTGADVRQDIDDWVIVRAQDSSSELVYGIARPIGQSLAGLRRTAGRNFLAGLGLVILALVGIAPLSRRITRDLNTLTEGAERLATGDLEVRVPVRSSDEVGHLARTFNQMAEDLRQNQARLFEEERLRKEHEIERRLLEAENSRKGRELEDARLFQLSLLPKALPRHEQLDIEVLMQTATEVGGDYYDFSRGGDGSLVVVIGDATGHGARAGTMVTVIKSLFSAAAGIGDLAGFLDNAARTIRRMELGRMAMASTLVRYHEHTLTVAAAGMPPVLIRRAATGEVEEVAVQGVPLGSMSDYVYREEMVELEPGDTVLLMSDGLPELTNDRAEPLGYAAVHQLFAAAPHESPQELIGRLAAAASEWTAGGGPGDDITFVAIRVRP